LIYWRQFREEKISKEQLRSGRLKDTFDKLQVSYSQDLIDYLSNEYIRVLPTNNHLFEGAIDLLNYLQPKYKLHIITNGFEGVQQLKLDQSGIKHYFKHIITSESVGLKKPNPKVFNYSMELANTTAEKSIMIGDSLEGDIIGALNCGMSGIHFTTDKNLSKNENYTSVSKLLEIKNYL